MRWISVRSTIERDANGKAIRLVGAHTDVTEQVMAEQALRQSEAEFRTLAEAVPHHVWTARPDGLLNWFNPRVYEYAGSGPGELDGEKWGGSFIPTMFRARSPHGPGDHASGEAYEVEFRLRRADGAFRWFLARAVPARDAQGRSSRWIGTNTDVHDQKLIAGELAELNATLAQRVEEKTRERDRIWNVSQDLLLVADRNGVWKTVNPAWTRTLGWSEAELLNRTSEWLEHPDDGGHHAGPGQKARRSEPPSGSKAAFATRTDRTAGCPGPASRTRTTSTRSRATSPPRRPRPNG
jgi:PAS domain S-box-containing protein